LFFESGRAGGSVFRLKSVLERLDRDRFEGGFLTWYGDQAATCLFEVPSLFCRRSLGLKRERPDTFKHLRGLPLPTPFALYYYLACRRIFARHKPDVAYMNTGIGFHEPAILAASRAGVPVACHLRSSAPLDPDERRAAPRVTRFVTSSRWGAQQFASELGRPAHEVDCVYEGIDLAAFDARARAEASPALPSGPVYACLVGSLIERKRPLLAIQGLAAARGRCPDLRLVLAGDGPLRSEVERMVVEARLEGSVIRLGRVSAVPSLLRQCHVGLLVSTSEGMPNAVMEYMAAGLPVVTSPVPGVDELVEHGRTGMVLPDPPTPETIAEALVALASSPERRAAFGASGRKKIEGREFSVEAEARGVGEVLGKLAGLGPEGGRRPPGLS
jgi:glycosyltransferase involved in cell wall biosynthesis